MKRKIDYDVIIIGAGIGGLVSSCYLAKSGMKVLLVEKNRNVGGFCTSFFRNGFNFDACANSLGSLGKKGILRLIMAELGIENRIEIRRSDPQDIILTSNGRFCFYNDLNRTKEEFRINFPKEAKKIECFFDYLSKQDDKTFHLLRGVSFQKILDRYFENEELKLIFSLLVFVNAGLPASEISASVAMLLCKEFILDGGYYPGNRMQELSDIFLARLKELKGDVLLSSLVSKIRIDNKCAIGIEVNKNTFFSARCVVSSIDARRTFFELIEKRYIPTWYKISLKEMKQSLSMFVLYLGLNKQIIEEPVNTNLWFVPRDKIEKFYFLASHGKVNCLDIFLLRLLSDRRSVMALVNSPFKNIKYWKNNKRRLIDLYVEKINKSLPFLSQHIVFKDAATPATLYRWTHNYQGSCYGWASFPYRKVGLDFSRGTIINNLYLASHWTSFSFGISGVASVSRRIAKMILQKEH